MSTHLGGTWGIPGGALNPGETPWQAARRETIEEVGYAASLSGFPGHEDALAGDWSYWTFVVTASDRFVGSFNWEVSEGGWFTVAEIAAMELLPALAAAWPSLVSPGTAWRGRGVGRRRGSYAKDREGNSRQRAQLLPQCRQKGPGKSVPSGHLPTTMNRGSYSRDARAPTLVRIEELRMPDIVIRPYRSIIHGWGTRVTTVPSAPSARSRQL